MTSKATITLVQYAFLCVMMFGFGSVLGGLLVYGLFS